MVKVCAILGCKNQTGEGFSFFSVPKIIPKDKESEQELQKKRRSLWIKQLKNKTDHKTALLITLILEFVMNIYYW